MKTRIILGALLIAVLSGLFYLDWAHERFVLTAVSTSPLQRLPLGIVMAAVLVLVMLQGLREMRGLAAANGVRILRSSALVSTLAIGLLPLVMRQDVMPSTLRLENFVLGIALGLVFFEQMIFRASDDALRSVGATSLTILYLGVGAAMMLMIRLDAGLMAFLLFLAAVKFTDIGAYFVGTAIGRHKMAPKISPGKSWEGLVGGLAAAAGASMLLTHLLHIPLTVGQAAIFGAVVGLAGQFADLCESALKRAAGVKDSGHFLPQFGGILDMLDSLLLSAPAAWLMLLILTGPK
ncbi:MAG: phosphatidate cytidylyltransferase [Planctomycetaceae bacterium]|nr:phosphatidate cytidylyltransferase [Planctomycetaceae bacterium]